MTGSVAAAPCHSRYNQRMTASLEKLDGLMERASQALTGADYLACEGLCLEALAAARGARRWATYARVLLPLQEARRQRLMAAAQGDVHLGCAPGFDPESWLDDHDAGCILLTHPHGADDALALITRARAEHKFIEVLFADTPSDNPTWELVSFEGLATSVTVDPPRPDQSLAQWFLHAAEMLGNAALDSVDSTLKGEALVLDLESRLAVFPDHELLLQRLAQAAHEASRLSHT